MVSRNNLAEAKKILKSKFREYFLGRGLKHEHIIRQRYFIYKYDKETGDREFHNIIELMDGQDMKVYLMNHGRAHSIDRVREIGRQLLSAIKYLHENRIVHHDIKPDNIVFNAGLDRVKLIDFGISALISETTQMDKVGGTSKYMSPEQIKN